MNIVNIWKPVDFSDAWRNANTSQLDDIAPSWYEKRKVIGADSKQYEEFITQLKRRHAIETGIIERLYDLKEGITETFIKEGFVESYMQHGDTNVDKDKLLFYLNDQFEAVQFIYEVVKDDRDLTKGFILELHSLLTRHQDYCDAVDSLGRRFQAKLIKGAFKKLENNPQRDDGEKYVYCPPEQVDTEVENLLSLYKNHVDLVKPVTLASWFHHKFTTIHPFQDGNGRMARLLASLILIKQGLFPLTVKREDKPEYFRGLREADEDRPDSTVAFFCKTQRRSIESVLNLKIEDTKATLSEVTRLFSLRMTEWKTAQAQERITKIRDNRLKLFEMASECMETIRESVQSDISEEIAETWLVTAMPDDVTRNYYHTHQIVEYAIEHKYFFNKSLPRGWFALHFKISEEVEYAAIITIHHYGYGDSTIAIGGFLEFTDLTNNERTCTPIPVPPYTLSLEIEIENMASVRPNLSSHIQQLITVALATIMSDIE